MTTQRGGWAYVSADATVNSLRPCHHALARCWWASAASVRAVTAAPPKQSFMKRWLVMVERSSDRTPLVGRGTELDRLLRMLDGFERGEGSVLVLRGEPGIGKSRLIAEAARQARDRGAMVLTASGVQSEAHLPFAGLHQLIRPVRNRAGALTPALRRALDSAFGLTDEAAPAPFRIAMAALDLVTEVAGEAPVLLLAEDAQWLDRPTAEVLTFIARRIQSDPVVFLAAERDGYPAGLVASDLAELRLTALDDVAAATLLDLAAPQLSLAARRQVLREAVGNPLAILELPVSVAADQTRSPAPVPSLTGRLERAFAGRAAELPDHARLLCPWVRSS